MKKNLFFGMAALLMAGFASCSNDDLLSDAGKPLEADQSFFANIDIVSTESMTRAGVIGDYGQGQEAYDPSKEPNFSEGEGKENEVKTIYLIFYDKNGDRVSTTQVRKENGQFVDRKNWPEMDPSINSLYKGVVQIDVKHGSLKPAYVMCFINPITSMNFEINPNFATLDALQKTTRPRIIDDNELFAMSKSVYYGPDRSDPDYQESWKEDETKYKKIVATPIGEGQLFNTVEEARDALSKDTKHDNPSMIDIYVERYASKVNFQIDGNATMQVKIDDDTTLEFVPEYWAVNAYEEETYICKSFLDSSLESEMSYETMNNALGGEVAWYWNSVAHHRCYWAQTPAYYKSEYPRVADDILDARTPSTGLKGGFALGYYSYEDMKKNAESNALNSKARKVTKGTNTTIYARENTVSGAALAKAAGDPLASPKAAVASAVLVGHYVINKDGQKTEIPADKYFYVMGNATNGYTLYDNTDDMLTWLVNTTVQFVGDDGETPFFNYGIEDYEFTNESYKDYFVIEHPQQAVRTYSSTNPAVIDSRFVTIQLNREKVLAADAPKLYAYLEGEYKLVTADNFNYVNQQMLYQAGTVQGFQGGKAFYNVPIKHLGFYRQGNKNAGKTGTEKNFDWTNVLSGDFGLVRNHVYSIVVDKIEGLGNGIPNTNDPIVPPTDPEEYFIGARIIVLNWAVVPSQHVTL